MGFFSEKQIDQLVSAPEVEKENNQEALKLAAGADTVVLALGENSLESEKQVLRQIYVYQITSLN